ncbi:MAG: molybdate ABC transporter substrate-binding protein [Betaproteobacteria bacterium]|nr:molybdate ABC transporter substrate-binding protein [Betaproteobacteria bacterium]
MPRICCGLLLVFPLLCATANAQSKKDVPTVAAASDLKFAVEGIATKFRSDTGRHVKFAFGSSGNFYRQIEQGAPFQMFMSADEDFIFRLAASGRAEDRGAVYAIGRIVLFAPHGSPLKVDAQMAGLKAALADGRIRRFAIANPEHAPYGRAAEQALVKLDLWKTLRPRLVLGENVSQAAQFAAGGSAEGGIFAYSLALAPSVSRLGTYALVPKTLHEPLRQRMALLKGAGETARAFYQYVQQPAARDLLKKYGFVAPGGQ